MLFVILYNYENLTLRVEKTINVSNITVKDILLLSASVLIHTSGTYHFVGPFGLGGMVVTQLHRPRNVKTKNAKKIQHKVLFSLLFSALFPYVTTTKSYG